ncbi:uncharacterized protein E6C27_scaffold205G001180 [Cucumis melo var. makuwa]|uniref:Uncharacterized protein n=1 Tax=Cucumis melo var. makuwa TaxID=1194695 RepID=A0A5A7VBL8_CUCMM|nr:uncharacterized protein E6C27_scaffold205G001180 [Cucumis melo var. makuwa]
MADPYFLDRSPSTGHNLTRITNNFHLENLAAVSGYSHGGLLQTPPRFLSAPSFHTHQSYPFFQQNKSPPLLPPPPTTPSNLRPHRSLHSQPRSHSLKKSKSTRKEKDSAAVVDRRIPSRTISSAGAAKRVVRVEELEKLSGCFFAIISPPPSSLPLPKFSMRPAKALKCNVEAAGADDGAAAADDLRRLLRLH